MELRHLQALTAISDHGTFSAAAEHLNTVQSNISAHVARLERELGAPLIDRADGRLTEEGTVVVARARRILSELDALVSDVAACKDEVTGTVRVGMRIVPLCRAKSMNSWSTGRSQTLCTSSVAPARKAALASARPVAWTMSGRLCLRASSPAAVTAAADASTVSAGGWSISHTTLSAPEVMNPIASSPLIASGNDGWWGWAKDERTEALRAAFARESDPARQKQLAEEIQVRAYDQVLYLPLGQIRVASAANNRLIGVLPAPVPLFWNIEKR